MRIALVERMPYRTPPPLLILSVVFAAAACDGTDIGPDGSMPDGGFPDDDVATDGGPVRDAGARRDGGMDDGGPAECGNDLCEGVAGEDPETCPADCLPTVTGTVYYVAPLSTSCNPTEPGSGTFEDPWVNPYYALTRGDLQPGDALQLRGGVYRNVYQGFMRDDSEEDRWTSCDDDEQTGSSRDGGHTVIPLFLAGTAEEPIIIENYPGEDVILDGTNARMESATWTMCAPGTYVTSDFNTGSARTPQVWVDPAHARDPGTRLGWNSDASGSCALEPGEFAADPDRNIYVRLADDSDPSTHDVHMTCQGGDCARHVIHADAGAERIVVRRNPTGGSFTAKYGYYIGYITAGAHHLTFDGLDWVAGGGRDYGYCFRVTDGNSVTLRNGLCREAMGEGVGYYGGGPQTGTQISDNVIENMEIFEAGRGWVDGGGNGTSLGMGVILKNCRDCAVRGSTIHGTYRSGIQVNFSRLGCPTETCDSSRPIIEGNTIWDFCRFRQGSNPNAAQTDCGAILLRNSGANGRIDGGTIRNNVIHGESTFLHRRGPVGHLHRRGRPERRHHQQLARLHPGRVHQRGPKSQPGTDHRERNERLQRNRWRMQRPGVRPVYRLLDRSRHGVQRILGEQRLDSGHSSEWRSRFHAG